MGAALSLRALRATGRTIFREIGLRCMVVHEGTLVAGATTVVEEVAKGSVLGLATRFATLSAASGRTGPSATTFLAAATAPASARVPWSTSTVSSRRGVLRGGVKIRTPSQRGGLFLPVPALNLQRDAPVDRVPKELV